MIRRDWGPVRREFKSQSRNGINIESTLLHPLKRKRGGGKKKKEANLMEMIHWL